MNSKNVGEGLKIALDFIFGLIGLTFLALTALVVMIVFAPIAIYTRVERYWTNAKKEEDDWMSKREDYLSGKK